jgi:hypothetical protein
VNTSDFKRLDYVQARILDLLKLGKLTDYQEKELKQLEVERNNLFNSLYEVK